MPAQSQSEPNVFLASEAARRKGCNPQTIVNAVERGELNATRQGRHLLVFRNDAFERWQVKETGGRLHAPKDSDE